MGLVKCKECSAEISDQAANCPACGKPRLRKSGKTMGIGCLGVLGLLALVIFVAVIVSNSKTEPRHQQPLLSYQLLETLDMAPYKWQVTLLVPVQPGGKYPDQADLEALAAKLARDKTTALGEVERWWVSFKATAKDQTYYADVHFDRTKGITPPRFSWFVAHP